MPLPAQCCRFVQAADKTVCANCVCSGAHCAAVGGFAALRMRRPLYGERAPCEGPFNRARALVHRGTPLTCHSEERSDVGISCRQLRFRRECPVIRPGTARLPRPLWGLAMTRQGSAAMGTVRRTELAVLLPLRGRAWLSPPLQGQCGLNGGRRMIHSSFFIIHYFIHPPAGDGKPYDKSSGNSLPFVQISPEPPDLSLTTGAFIDKIISENKGAVCPLQQARQPAKNLFVTHDPNTRDQYRRTTQWIKNASLP